MSIGVSNFGIDELKILASAKITPAVNQIFFHPYILERQAPIIDFGRQHGIVAAGATRSRMSRLCISSLDVVHTSRAGRSTNFLGDLSIRL